VAATQDGLKVLDQRAAHALRPGITVAFFPPDRCRDIAAADTKATSEATDMANTCGVLISALENSVADRYSVVSWQTLKPRGIHDDPFEKAAARKVDVIFEVDSFGMNKIGQSASNSLRIDFGEQTDPNDRTPIVLDPVQLPAVAGRCKVGVDRMEIARAQAGMVGSFTGAIKAVEVSSGRALLYYQRTLTDVPGEESSAGYDLYFRAEGTLNYTPPIIPPPRYNSLQNLGMALTLIGAGLVLIGGGLRYGVFNPTTDDFGNKVYKQPGTAATGGMFLGGFFVAGGGITMLTFGNRKAKRTPAPTVAANVKPPVYPAPAEVLCVQPSTPPWLQTGPAWTEPAQGGSSYSFAETTTVSGDPARERENRLRKLVIDDFTQELGQLPSK
jgi:hypothetical protein